MAIDWLSVIHFVAREAMLLAAIGILIGGIDDLAVDAIYGLRWLRRRLAGERDRTVADLPRSDARIAIFVGAWDEAGVIGAMIRSVRTRFGDADYRLYIGTYPNDTATIAEARAAAADDARIRVIVGDRAGPTSKAGNLNTLWRALLSDEALEGRAMGIVLHDAEDLVHPRELDVYAAYLAEFDAVQVPVMPLVSRKSPLVSGHYVDEFMESHGKQLVVRRALGAGLPFAGVGCAIRREMLGRIAEARSGEPFDSDSLTEDYELGLTVAALGGRETLAWVTEDDHRTPVAIRAYFPDTFAAAVQQKSRWVAGIALSGWDRTGWGGRWSPSEYWMRMHDRRGLLGILVVLAAYIALICWTYSWVIEWLGGRPAPAMGETVRILLMCNVALLVWRTIVRGLFTGKLYGWRQGLLAFPRMVAGNFISFVAAVQAVRRYVRTLRGAAPDWGKTSHVFPTDLAEGHG